MCLESWTNTKIYHLVTIDWCMQARQRNSVMDGFQLQLQLFRHATKQCHVGTPVHKLTILLPTREISNRGRKKTFKSIQYLHSTFFLKLSQKNFNLTSKQLTEVPSRHCHLQHLQGFPRARHCIVISQLAALQGINSAAAKVALGQA